MNKQAWTVMELENLGLEQKQERILVKSKIKKFGREQVFYACFLVRV